MQIKFSNQTQLYKPEPFKLKNLYLNPHTAAKRRHTLLRLLNLIIIKIQKKLRSPYLLGYPHCLVIETTNICNLKCPLCPTGQNIKGRQKGKMSFENFRKIIDELACCLYAIRLDNWGEPLLNDSLADMISYAHQKKINTSLNTNLTVLDQHKAEQLILSGLDHIKISLDGAGKESYEQYRLGSNFNRVIDNIRLLTSKRTDLNRKNPFIEVQFIVMRHNEQEIEQMEQLCTELGVDRLLLEALRLDMRGELLNLDSYCIEKYKDWLPSDSKFSLFDYQTKRRKFYPQICNELWISSVINWDGSVVPCCGIYDVQYDFGNIFGQRFRDIWNGPKYRAARRLIGKHRQTKEKLACKFCFKDGIIS